MAWIMSQNVFVENWAKNTKANPSRMRLDNHYSAPSEFLDPAEYDQPTASHVHRKAKPRRPNPRMSIIERNKQMVIRKSNQLSRRKIAAANQKRRQNALKSKGKMLKKSKRILQAAAERRRRTHQARTRQRSQSLSFRTPHASILPDPEPASQLPLYVEIEDIRDEHDEHSDNRTPFVLPESIDSQHEIENVEFLQSASANTIHS